MKIIEYDPKTGVSTIRTASRAEAARRLKESIGKFSEEDSEPMFMRRLREEVLRKTQRS
jgi:hypothetical protein